MVSIYCQRGCLREVDPSKRLLLHAVMHDDNSANNGEILLSFGLLIARLHIGPTGAWYNILEDQRIIRQYRGKSI